MAAHSPAPWEMHPAPYGWDIWANTPEKFRQWIAPVTRLSSPHKAIFDGSIEVDAATCEANARLMASAPDLLDVAKGLRQHLALFCGPDDAVAAEVFRVADAAIAKAEGKS